MLPKDDRGCSWMRALLKHEASTATMSREQRGDEYAGGRKAEKAKGRKRRKGDSGERGTGVERLQPLSMFRSRLHSQS